jgi:S-adenosylmethionine hydrolase
MAVVTLTTDWGTTDYFAAALKGEILSAALDAIVVDVSHDIAKFNQVHGGFVLKNAWTRFPEGTVHVAAVCSTGGEPPSLLALAHEKHFFLGPDDGFFSLVFDEIPAEIYHVRNSKGDKVLLTSATIGASAAYLAKGGKISKMGDKPEEVRRKLLLRAAVEEDIIKGSVIYIDSFGNLVTNITQALINRFAKGRGFEVVMKKSEYSIEEISMDYFSAGQGNMLATFNEAGYLEIAISGGDAAGLLNMKYGDIVRIEFK